MLGTSLRCLFLVTDAEAILLLEGGFCISPDKVHGKNLYKGVAEAPKGATIII